MRARTARIRPIISHHRAKGEQIKREIKRDASNELPR